MKTVNKVDALISKSLIDLINKQATLAKATCAIANKAMAAMMKIDKLIQPKLVLSTNLAGSQVLINLSEATEQDRLILILKLTKEKIISSVTQAVLSYAKVLQHCNLSNENKQDILDKVIKETKMIIAAKQITIDSFNSYIKAASSLN